MMGNTSTKIMSHKIIPQENKFYSKDDIYIPKALDAISLDENIRIPERLNTNSIKISHNNDPTLYIIINHSIKMTIGKIASQIGHGIIKVHTFLLNNNINHSNWLNNGEKIVVLKADHQIMRSLIDNYEIKIIKQNTINIFPIYDAGKTQVESNSLTIIITTPITDDKVPEIIKKLKLY